MLQREDGPERDGEVTPSDTELSAGSEQDNEPSWETVLNNEELDLPAGVSGNTEELVGAVVEAESPRNTEAVLETPPPEDSFFGFEDTVSVNSDEFKASQAAAAENFDSTHAQQTHLAAGAQQVQPQAEDHVVSAAGAPSDQEPTQVLRRSLITPPPAAPVNPVEATTVQPLAATDLPVDTQAAPRPVPVSPAVGVAAPSFEEAMAQPVVGLSIDDTVLPELPSRALPRTLSLLLTLIFTPVTWYLISDAAARLAFADANPMLSGILNPAALGELMAGLIGLIIIAILAAQSSLGLIVTGVITLAVGVPFLVVPGLVAESGYWGVGNLANFNAFGGNVANHFMATGFTGLFVALGTLMIALGWALAAVRRSGRSEEAQRIVVSSTNPAGLRARWARKASRKHGV